MMNKLVPLKYGGGYIVKTGDTLSLIAKDKNTTVEHIMKYNNLNSDRIKVGQKLRIPTKDIIIGDTENYGWDHPVNRGKYDKNRLKETVDPGEGFGIRSYLSNGLHYLFNIKQDNSTNLSTKHDRAFFQRHLGFPRNYDLMPITNIKFSGDFNKDGTPRLPNAEYVGLDRSTKDFIKEGIEKGYIDIDKDGFWKVKKENQFSSWTNKTSHLGSYSIRENNHSGIYDVFDTYDFDEAISNRLPGYQIEIRDTIHGLNARPELYDKTFSTKKAELNKQNRKRLKKPFSFFNTN